MKKFYLISVLIVIFSGYGLNAQAASTGSRGYESPGVVMSENPMVIQAENPPLKAIEGDAREWVKAWPLFDQHHTTQQLEKRSVFDERWKQGGIYEGFKPENELIENRTRDSKTFLNEDGSYTIQFSGNEHYLDKSGAWQDVNFTIGDHSGDGFEAYPFSNLTNDFNTFFPGTPGEVGLRITGSNFDFTWWKTPQLQLSDQNKRLVFSLRPGNVAAVLENTPGRIQNDGPSNKLVFKNIYPGMDEEFMVHSDHIVNDIIIHSLDEAVFNHQNAHYLGFAQFIPLAVGAKVYVDDHPVLEDFSAHSFSIQTDTSSKRISFAPILVFDGNIAGKTEANNVFYHSERGENLHPLYANVISGEYFVRFTEEGIWLTAQIPLEWLLNEKRRFPVTFDPDVFVGTNYARVGVLWDGYYTDTRLQTIILSSELVNAGLPNGAIITDIGLYAGLYANWVNCPSNHTGLKIRMKNTTATTTTAFDNTGYTNNYNGSHFINSTGWWNHVLSVNSFTFNQAQNLLIDFSMDMTNYLCSYNHNEWAVWNAGYNRSRYGLWRNDIVDPQTQTGGTGWSYVPYLRITYVVGCQQPLNIIISSVTMNTATIAWSAPTPAPSGGYLYEIRTSGAPGSGPAGLAASGSTPAGVLFANITGLTPNTNYFVYVRSFCGGINYSPWAGPQSFQTLPGPCNILSTDWSGSSRTPQFLDDIYYFDVCQNETLSLDAQVNCNGCTSEEYSYFINAYDGNGPILYSANPLNYTILLGSGYDATLEFDGGNCHTSIPLRFRSSSGPDITVVTNNTEACAGNITSIKMGGSGNEVEVEPYHGEVNTSLGVGETTFIPDGPNCATQCYTSSVTFTDFPIGHFIKSAEDVLYLRLNLEHTFIGDLQISLVGPDNCGSVILVQDQLPNGLDPHTYNWPWRIVMFYCVWPLNPNYGYFNGYGVEENGTFTSSPNRHEATVYNSEAEAVYAIQNNSYNISCNSPYTELQFGLDVANLAFGVPNVADFGNNPDPCNESALNNSPGTGWDYIWSNNNMFQYAPGTSLVYDPLNVQLYDVAEAPYAFLRVNPSDAENSANFYHPYEGFENLVGCPLNGTWTIKVCDSWALDNGYIFEWEMALEPDLMPANWSYTPEIKLVDWDEVNFSAQLLDGGYGSPFPWEYGVTPNPSLPSGTYTGEFMVYDEYNCGTPASFDFTVQGLPEIPGIVADDFIWSGYKNASWDNATFGNWLVKTSTGFDHAITVPGGSKNVYIVDYCDVSFGPSLSLDVSCRDLNILSGSLLANNRTLRVFGDFDNRDRFFAGTGTVVFAGSDEQEIRTGGVGTGKDFYKVSVSNSGAGLKLYGNDIQITESIEFNDGVLNADGQMVVVTNTSPGAVNEGNSGSYVFGNLRRHILPTGLYSFPVGSSDKYRLAQLVNNDLTGISYIDARFLSSFTNENPASLIATDFGTPYMEVAEAGIWEITPNAQPGSGSYAIKLYFDQGGFGLSDNKFGVIRRANTSTSAADWIGEGVPKDGFISPLGGEGRLVSDGFALRYDLGHFSQFGIGKSNDPLPIELLSFTATYHEPEVLLEWATGSEINNDFFTLERSADVEQAEIIGYVEGAGNSSQTLWYSFVDQDPLPGISYYRLKQTDFDGKFEYFDWVAVDAGTADGETLKVLVETLPLGHNLRIFSPRGGRLQVEVVDLLGRKVVDEELTLSDQGQVEVFIPASANKHQVLIYRVTDGLEVVAGKIVR